MRSALCGGFAAVVMLSLGSTANAATITVDTTTDSAGAGASGCSLRNAVIAADQEVAAGNCTVGSGNDVIKVPQGVYELSRNGIDENLGGTGDLDLWSSDAVTIEPASATAKVSVDGLNLDRILHLGGTGSLTLKNLTLTHGSSVAAADPLGGAINVATGGSLELDGVLVRDSRAQLGGALFNQGSAKLLNSTLSGNRATTYGGGIVASGASVTDVRSSTVAFNRADSDASGDGDGGGLFAPTETVTMTNTILANNFDDSPSGLNLPDCVAGAGFTPRFVISTQALDCQLGANPGVSNQSPVDPKLAALADNGGVTFTHALGAASPALNSGGVAAPDLCPATDQRGLTRSVDECDIGAFEVVPTHGPGPNNPDPDPDPVPLPGISAPTNTTASFDGVNLHIRLKCPARFKPKCISKAVPVTARKKGKPMAAAKSVKTVSNGWKRVSFRIKPAFRPQVKAMTFVDSKQLVIRQKIKAKRPANVFHKYKVRVKI